MSILTASILVYVGFGLVYYSGTVIGFVKMIKNNETDFSDLKEFRNKFQGSMGICWKILGYMFLPVGMVMFFIMFVYMMIASRPRGDNDDAD